MTANGSRCEIRGCQRTALGREAALAAFPAATSVERHSLAERCSECAELERRLQRDGLAEVHAGPAQYYLEGASAGASLPEPPPAEPLRALWEAREAYLDRLRDPRDWEIIDCRLRGFTVAVTAERLEISPDQVERRMTDLRQEAERFVEARDAVKRRSVLQLSPDRQRRIRDAMRGLAPTDLLGDLSAEPGSPADRRWQLVAVAAMDLDYPRGDDRLDREFRSVERQICARNLGGRRRVQGRCPACGRFLPTSSATGRLRKYCDRPRTCRQRAYRSRPQ